MNPTVLTAVGVTAIVTLVVSLTFERPPIDTVQRGYRGLGMEQVYNPRVIEAGLEVNRVPPPVEKVEPGGTPSREVYQNVQVLGDVDSEEFNRLMQAITEWVSPEQGCAYCHAEGEELSSDSLYTKVVSRRMLQMTKHINAEWKTHVGATGVTCYTCHRGQPVPANIWFTHPDSGRSQGMAGNRAGQNEPEVSVAYASLPNDPFTRFLSQPNEIRVVSKEALPNGNLQSTKQTEGTYGLMMHMSQALGVNCTYCHNTRSFASWDQSTPARANSWYGIRMMRDLNNNYLDPLQPVYPAHRLGALGDAPKANCTTCHIGAFKPLYGASMLVDYPELGTAPPPGPAAALAVPTPPQ